jgi:phage shock protein PspC (stress-responsive transcriptional regulator)
MKKTIRIHITGYIFNIEEDAFEVLENWLKKISIQYEKEDGGEEIINDIETRVAEIFKEEIKDDNSVISLKDVNKVIEIMGNPEEFENKEFDEKGDSEKQNTDAKGSKIYKRLFRDEEQRILGGICAGIAHYFGIDVSLIRIIFIAGIFIGGFAAVLYLILWIFIPAAETSSQKLEMKGKPVNISNIEKVIKTEFENVRQNLINKKNSESFKTFTNDLNIFFDKLGSVIVKILKAISGFVGLTLMICGIASIIALFGIIFFHDMQGFINVGPDTYLWYPFFTLLPLPFSNLIASIGIFLLIAIPLAGIIFAGIRVIFRYKRSQTKSVRVLGTTLWFIGIIITGSIAFNVLKNYRSEKSITKTYILEDTGSDFIRLKINNTYIKKFDKPEFQISNFNVVKLGEEYNLFGKPNLNISKSKEKDTKLKLIFYARGNSEPNAAKYINQINWRWIREDTVLLCDPYFTVAGNNKLYLRELTVDLEIPEGKTVYIDSSLRELINDVEVSEHMNSSELFGKKLIMTEKGLILSTDSMKVNNNQIL